MASYDFEIIIGTYEGFLLGYLCSVKDKEIKQSLASHDHSNNIRTITHCGKYVASGAADDRIIIYDFDLRKECYMLINHTATINCLAFTNENTHLISGSDDGVLAITRVGNWQMEKQWDKAHKGLAVYDVAIHPSGKLALTIGADSTLRTWNLIKGRQAYAINLTTKSKDPKSLDKIIWSPDGTHFILYGGKNTEIWDIEVGGMLKYIDYDTKVTCCIWLKPEKILVGHENGAVTIVKLTDCTKNSKQAHDSRIKSMVKYKKWIVSISSSGEFKVWTSKLVEILKGNIGCRPTCLSTIPILKIKKEEPSDTEIQEDTDLINFDKESKVIIELDDEDSTVQKNVHKKKRKYDEKNDGDIKIGASEKKRKFKKTK